MGKTQMYTFNENFKKVLIWKYIMITQLKLFNKNNTKKFTNFILF